MSIMGRVNTMLALPVWIKRLICNHWYYEFAKYRVYRIFFVKLDSPAVVTEYKCAECGNITKELHHDDYGSGVKPEN